VVGSEFQKILSQQHIISNFPQIKEMLLVNAGMASVFVMGQEFHQILSQQHIISNFQQIKDMVMVNAGMASVFVMGSEFQKILSQQHIISNFQPNNAIPWACITSQYACSPAAVCSAILQSPFNVLCFPLHWAAQTVKWWLDG
jgi:hypothetical protein